jgi:hypothetical protein
MKGKEQTYYLSSKGGGLGTTEKSEAAICHIDEKTQLICGSATVGASVRRDMIPLGYNMGQDITTGFSLDNAGLHWRNSKFANAEMMAARQHGEAEWALRPSGATVSIWAQLGCPTGTHGHSDLAVGTLRVIPM